MACATLSPWDASMHAIVMSRTTSPPSTRTKSMAPRIAPVSPIDPRHSCKRARPVRQTDADRTLLPSSAATLSADGVVAKTSLLPDHLPGWPLGHHRYGEPLGTELGHDGVEARPGEQLEAEPRAPHALA